MICSLVKESLQLVALSCVLLASKMHSCEVPIKKIHKYAGYSYTNQDLALTQLKSNFILLST